MTKSSTHENIIGGIFPTTHVFQYTGRTELIKGSGFLRRKKPPLIYNSMVDGSPSVRVYVPNAKKLHLEHGTPFKIYEKQIYSVEQFFKKFGLDPSIQIVGANNQVRVLFDYGKKIINTDFLGDWAILNVHYDGFPSYDSVEGEEWDLAYALLKRFTPLPENRPEQDLEKFWNELLSKEVMVNVMELGSNVEYTVPGKKA